MYKCPSCDAKGAIQRTRSGWIVSGSGVVGYIRTTALAKFNDEDVWEVHGDWWEDEPHPHPLDSGPLVMVEYMLGSTGIRSGSIWRERDAFASREEAQAECDKRNHYVAKKEAA
jgi:hypothetical protein